MPDRKGLRLDGYDYHQPGFYFVTICLRDRLPRFGQVHNGELHLNAAGRVIEETWASLPSRFPSVLLDAYIVMPDHLHAILFLGYDPDTREELSLSDVIRVFKSVSTNRYIAGVKQEGWPRFDERLWLKSFHDRIGRSERELEAKRLYIERNPARWSEKRGK